MGLTLKKSNIPFITVLNTHQGSHAQEKVESEHFFKSGKHQRILGLLRGGFEKSENLKKMGTAWQASENILTLF